eukprot:3312410-Amphidinium_carterae.1
MAWTNGVQGPSPIQIILLVQGTLDLLILASSCCWRAPRCLRDTQRSAHKHRQTCLSCSRAAKRTSGTDTCRRKATQKCCSSGRQLLL